jgi:hypothetical protein
LFLETGRSPFGSAVFWKFRLRTYSLSDMGDR